MVNAHSIIIPPQKKRNVNITTNITCENKLKLKWKIYDPKINNGWLHLMIEIQDNI